MPAGLPTGALCLLVIWTAVTSWQAWMPGAPASVSGLYEPAVSASPNEATNAFTTALPDGSHPSFGPVSLRQPWFPVDPIENDVRSVLGPSASPVTLSPSEELFAYVNWPGYMGVAMGAAGTNTGWPARYAALKQLSRVTDPAAFAAAAADTSFGPIDVFILDAGQKRWTWTPTDSSVGAISFSPAQFNRQAFTVFTGLHGHIVVAVRRPLQNS